MSFQVARLFEIILRLPRQPKYLTTSDIKTILDSQGMNVDIKTIQRDMQLLDQVLRPRISSKRLGRQYCWYYTEDAKVINPKGLTINQALTFNVLKKYLTPLFPASTLADLAPFFEEADATLENFHENPILNWPQKIAIVQPTQKLLPPELDPEVQKAITEALLKDRQLEICYRPPHRDESSYKLNPLGLVLRNGVSYLIATKIETNDERTFALHRVKSVKITDQPAIHPEGFDLQKALDNGKMGFNFTGQDYQPIQLKAIFDKIAISHLYETKLSEDQKIEKLAEDRFEITATVQESEQLFCWLQSFGSRVEVLEPAELRDKMMNSIKILAEKYQLQ